MTPDDSNRLEALLREGLPSPEVPDDGFTERVVAALPRRRSAAPSRAVLLSLVWVCAAVGSSAALWNLAFSDEIADAVARIDLPSTDLVVNPWTAVAFTGALVSYVYALLAARAASRP